MCMLCVLCMLRPVRTAIGRSRWQARSSACIYLIESFPHTHTHSHTSLSYDPRAGMLGTSTDIHLHTHIDIHIHTHIDIHIHIHAPILGDIEC